MSDTVNINKNSYFTMKVNDNSYAYIESLDDFSLCGGNAFTLLFVFYPLQTQMDICLMKQEDAFEIGYQNHRFYYHAKGMENIWIEGIKPIENRWNSIAVTYDESIMKVYYQGIKAYEQEISTEFCTNSNESIIGETFSGYIKKVCCFDKALPRNSLNSVLYSQDSEESKKTAMFYLDFEGVNAVDYGRYNKPIQIKNQARQVNIVKALQVNDNGYLQNIEAVEGQYKELFSESYTILTKAYLNITFKKSSIIFNNGEYGDKNGLTIGIKNETTGAKLFLDCMGERIFSEKNLPYDQWVDIGVTVDNEKVIFYKDGEQIGKGYVNNLTEYSSSYKMTLGNGLQKGVPVQGMYFDGCIDYFSVFNSALDSEKLKTYVEVPPFIYNKDIAILYSFTDNSNIEKISNTTYTLSNAFLEIQEGTECCCDFESPCYCDETKYNGLSEYELWEANFMAILLTSYIEAQTGIKPTSGFVSEGVLSNGAAQMMHTNVVPLESSKKSIASLYDVSEEDIINVESEIRYRGFDSVINETFYGGAGVDVIAGASTAGEMAAAVGTASIPLADIVLSVTAIALTATIITAAIIEIPPPIVEGKIILKSISFHWKNKDEEYDYSKKAIPLAIMEDVQDGSGYKKKQMNPPEWLIEKDGGTSKVISQPICYIQEKVNNPIIRAEFEYKSGDPKNFTGPISASISVNEQNHTGKKGERSALGDISPKNVAFDEDGIYVVDFELDNCKLQEEELGYVQCVWLWKVGKNNLIIGSSSHDIYIIGKEPVKPWNYEGNNPLKMVSWEFLRLWGDLTKKTGGVTAATVKILGTKLSPAFFESRRFQYNKISEVYVEKELGVFSTIQYYSGIPIFHKEKFEHTYCKDQNEIINITSLDASCIMEAIFKMNGVNATLLNITSNCEVLKSEYMDEEENTISSYIMIPIYFRDIINIGASQVEPVSEAIHYVLSDIVVEESKSIDAINNYNKSYIIDPTISVKDTEGKKRYAAYLPFSDDVGDMVGGSENTTYYRELFGQSYSEFQIYRIFNSVVFDAVKVEDKITLLEYQQLEAEPGGINYDPINGFTYIGFRPVFRDAVLNYITVEECKTERCHYVSYATIRDIVLGIYNACIFLNREDNFFYIDAVAIWNLLKCLYTQVLCYNFDIKINNIQNQKAKESIKRLHYKTLESINKLNRYPILIDQELLELIHENISLLNSSFYNLRKGERSWNQRIQDSYDCASWAAVSSKSGKVVYNCLEKFDALAPDEKIWFYLGDPMNSEDVHKLLTIKEIVSAIDGKIADFISFSGQSIYFETEYKAYIVIGSSNNKCDVWGKAQTNLPKIPIHLSNMVYYDTNDGQYKFLFS